jgi:hypothetical protein
MGSWDRDFNIVLAHRGPWMGLWLTVTSCEQALRGSGLKYGYVIVMNGETTIPEEMKFSLGYLSNDDKLTQFVVSPKPLSPPSARQLGTVFGDGRYIFFFDNHCMVDAGYFQRAITQMDEKNIDVLHSTTMFHTSSEKNFEYTMQLDVNFWATHMANYPKSKREPYRIGMGGHGGFVVRRSAWNDLGGYWTGFEGYGGEETYFDMKAWLLGKEVWIDPQLIHYHFAGNRSYPRHATDDYYRNMLMCANVIGGEPWMYKVYDTFSRSSKSASSKQMFDLLLDAEAKSNDHAHELAARRIRTLDEQLVWFTENDIPH